MFSVNKLVLYCQSAPNWQTSIEGYSEKESKCSDDDPFIVYAQAASSTFCLLNFVICYVTYSLIIEVCHMICGPWIMWNVVSHQPFQIIFILFEYIFKCLLKFCNNLVLPLCFIFCPVLLISIMRFYTQEFATLFSFKPQLSTILKYPCKIMYYLQCLSCHRNIYFTIYLGSSEILWGKLNELGDLLDILF